MTALKFSEKHAQGQRYSKWHTEQTVQWTEGGAMPGMFEEEQEGKHVFNDDEVNDEYEVRK